MDNGIDNVRWHHASHTCETLDELGVVKITNVLILQPHTLFSFGVKRYKRVLQLSNLEIEMEREKDRGRRTEIEIQRGGQR